MVGQAFLPASAGHSCPAESARGVPLAEADKNVCPTEHLRRDISPTLNVQKKKKALSPALSQRTGRGSRVRCNLGSSEKEREGTITAVKMNQLKQSSPLEQM